MACNRFQGRGGVRNAWTALCTTILLSLYIFSPALNASSVSSLGARASPSASAGSIALRVLPIGDSITYGAPVKPYNGYRKELDSLLLSAGYTVDFVGSVQAGDFADNDNEGHRGKIIDEISNMSAVGIYAAPNVVLLHAGTNDMNFNVTPSGAPDRLSNLIKYIYDHSPNAVVFVAQIIPSTTQAILDRIKVYNKAIPGVVNNWVDRGKNVTLVNMYDAVNKDTDLYDNLHPNSVGYSKMAHVWYNAIRAADANGWITKAGTPETPPAT